MSQRKLIDSWKQNTLDTLLKAQVLAWLPGYLAGCWNALYSYQQHEIEPSLALRALLLSLAIYSLAYGALPLITFAPRLSYRARVALMLGMYYALSAGLFWLSALSGDARLFLFVFLVFSAVFLEHPYPYIALGLAMLNFGLMGWLHLSGVIVLAEPDRYNAHDPSAWITGSIVFFIIGLTTVITIQFLLHSFKRTLERQQLVSQFLSLGNAINQLIVREPNSADLLQKTCQLLQQNGYSTFWFGLRATDGPGWEKDVCQSAEHQSTETQFLRELAGQAVTLGQKTEALHFLALPLLRKRRCFGALALRLQSTELQEKQLLEEIADDLAYAFENLQITHQRETLTRIAEELLGERSETTIWQIALSAIRRLLLADRAAIYEYDPVSDRLSCPYFSGLSPQYVQTINEMFRNIPGGQLLASPQPVIIEDTLLSPLTQNIRSLLESEAIRAYAVFPLSVRNQFMAALVVYYRYPRSFSMAEIAAGQTLAQFLAAALQNARLFAEIRAKSSEQAALFIAAQETTVHVNNFPALLGLLSQQMASVLHVTSSYILSIEDDNKMFRVLSEYRSDEASSTERKSDLGRAYPVSDFPLILTAARQGMPLLLDEDDPRLLPSEQREFIEYGVKTKLFLPLIWQGDLVGVVELWESRAPRRFSQHEIHLAQTLASHAAGALRAAKLFSELESREAYFRALTENAAEGVAVLSAQGEFKYVSRLQEQMLGYESAKISLQGLKRKIHPEDWYAAVKAFRKSRQLPHTPVTLTCRIQNHKGRWRVLEATLNNLLAEPAIRGIVVNFRDITLQKQAEAQLRQAYDETLAGWARALELRDKDTEGHTRRVIDLTLRLARAMNVDEEQLVHIRRGALLHDIGKVAIPDSILQKTDTLTAQEWEKMRQHPQYAYDMLKEIAYLRPALDIPYCHHEKWDGTGYPRGLKEKEIPLAARIFAVADVWDALTSNRPYRPGWDTEKTLQYIQEQAGKHFDPEIVERFVKLIQ